MTSEVSSIIGFDVKNQFKSPLILVTLIMSAFFSFIGIFFAMWLPYIVICGLILVHIFFGWIPFRIVKFGFSSFAKKLSILPFVNYKGEWVLEVNSETRDLSSLNGFKQFVTDFVKYLTIPMIAVRVLSELFLTFIYGFEVETNLDLFVSFTQFFPVTAIFVIIITIKDVELKIYKKRKDGVGIKELSDSSHSIAGIISIIFGTTIIANFANNDLSGEIVVFFFVTGGMTFFMCILYYQTPFYKNNVNKIRNYLIENKDHLKLQIGSTEYSDLFCNKCDNINQFPNYFCSQCGNDLSNMRTKFVREPIIIGSLNVVESKLENFSKIESEPIENKFWYLLIFFVIIGIFWFPLQLYFFEFLSNIADS